MTAPMNQEAAEKIFGTLATNGSVESMGDQITSNIVSSITGLDSGEVASLTDWTNDLMGRDISLASRVARIEGKIAVGAEFFDDFNRGDSANALGNGWVQGGSGQALGIYDQAAQLARDPLPGDGRRYAISPQGSTNDDVTVSAVIHPRGTPNNPSTILFLRANTSLTEFVYAEFYNKRCFLGRGTRSGNSWTLRSWQNNTAKSYSNSATVEFKAIGNKYQVVIDGVSVLEHEDISGYPIDSGHRTVGFALQTWTAILAIPEYSGGLASFAVRSSVELGGVQAANQSAAQANQAAQAAQTSANNAVADATQAATQAANSAVGEIRKEVIQQIAVFDIKSPTAGWIAINGTEWPSIPRAMLTMQPRRSTSMGSTFSATPSGSTGSHSHGMGSFTMNMDQDPEGSMVATAIRFSYIRIPVDTELSGLNFYAKGVPTDLRVRLYLMDPTGDLSALTPESGNLASLLVSGRHTATPWNFPENVLVEAGTWVAVGFRSVGTVALAGINMFDPDPPAGFYPIKLGSTKASTSGTAMPDSITESGNLSWADGFVAYVAVGNNIVVEQEKRFLQDDFDRPDSTAFTGIGPGWAGGGSTGIRSNAVSWTTNDNGVANAVYSTPLTTDKAVTGIHVGTPQPTAWSRMFVRCRSNYLSGIAISFRREGDSGSGRATLTVDSVYKKDFLTATAFTQLNSASVALNYGDSIEAQVGAVVGDVYDAERLIVSINGLVIFDMKIPTATVPFGPQRRYFGFGLSRTPFQNSTTILDWFARDVPDVVPVDQQ